MNTADLALRRRIEAEARHAELLRRQAAELSQRICDQAATTEHYMHRIRLRWLGEPHAGRNDERAGDDLSG